MPEARCYCMCCGEDVETTTVHRDGKVEVTCIYCGFTLDIIQPEAPPRRDTRCIMVVDDSDMARNILHGLLVKAGLAQTVIALGGGQEFIAEFTRRLTAGHPVDLVILDIEMPGIDGFTAARFMRALEAKLGALRRPIIFFSGRKSDENLRRQMSLAAPARYLNKGASDNVEDLLRRVEYLVANLQPMLQGA